MIERAVTLDLSRFETCGRQLSASDLQYFAPSGCESILQFVRIPYGLCFHNSTVGGTLVVIFDWLRNENVKKINEVIIECKGDIHAIMDQDAMNIFHSLDVEILDWNIADAPIQAIFNATQKSSLRVLRLYWVGLYGPLLDWCDTLTPAQFPEVRFQIVIIMVTPTLDLTSLTVC